MIRARMRSVMAPIWATRSRIFVLEVRCLQDGVPAKFVHAIARHNWGIR